jgi:hypothetical protein
MNDCVHEGVPWHLWELIQKCNHFVIFIDDLVEPNSLRF